MAIALIQQNNLNAALNAFDQAIGMLDVANNIEILQNSVITSAILANKIRVLKMLGEGNDTFIAETEE